MKTKKANGKADKATNAESALERLNALYAKYTRAHERLMKEYEAAYADMDDAFWGKKKAVKIASANFNLMRKSLPATKFDMTSGEYFYAENAGKEVFAIKVSRTEACTFHVTAKDAEEAKKKAIDIIKLNERLMQKGGIVAEDVCR